MLLEFQNKNNRHITAIYRHVEYIIIICVGGDKPFYKLN